MGNHAIRWGVQLCTCCCWSLSCWCVQLPCCCWSPSCWCLQLPCCCWSSQCWSLLGLGYFWSENYFLNFNVNNNIIINNKGKENLKIDSIFYKYKVSIPKINRKGF